MRSATSSGRVKRPVGDCPAAPCRTSAGSAPVARDTVAATPSAPSQRSVATGPGLTELTRMPAAASSFDSDFEKLSSPAFAAL